MIEKIRCLLQRATNVPNYNYQKKLTAAASGAQRASNGKQMSGGTHRVIVIGRRKK